MKFSKLLLPLCLLFVGLATKAQVGIGTNTPAASAQLEVSSTSKGFLPPRMTEAQKNAISAPADGLVIFQTDGTSGLYLRNAGAWKIIDMLSGVPYTGATQAVNLGAYDLKVNGLTVGKGLNEITANTAIGNNVLANNTIGDFNTAVGFEGLKLNTTGVDNTAVGYYALTSNLTGFENVALGESSLEQNTIGNSNTATGNIALAKNTTGNYNTASGHDALYKNTTGSLNVGVGASALYNNITGSKNIGIGYGADVSPGNLQNAIVIGSDATVSTSNTIQLGNTNITDVKTAGKLTTGTVTYPNTHNAIAGQVLKTDASGVASWAAGLIDGTSTGDMLYWNGTAWVKVAAGSNGQTLTFIKGVPTWSYTYLPPNTVVSSNNIWMDRNLGATQVATSSTDVAAYGDLYQWGRATDGHQIRTSTTTNTLSTTDAPGNGSFILTSNSPYDWRDSKNDNLWQGLNGINNPCPSGFRIPTSAEWNAERISWGANNSTGGFNSPLKLTVGGIRLNNYGGLSMVGHYGSYWTSTINQTNAVSLYLADFSPNYASLYTTDNRSTGMSVRCIKD